MKNILKPKLKAKKAVEWKAVVAEEEEDGKTRRNLELTICLAVGLLWGIHRQQFIIFFPLLNLRQYFVARSFVHLLRRCRQRENEDTWHDNAARLQNFLITALAHLNLSRSFVIIRVFLHSSLNSRLKFFANFSCESLSSDLWLIYAMHMCVPRLHVPVTNQNERHLKVALTRTPFVKFLFFLE